MYYINSQPTANGNHGNPSSYGGDCVLPDEFLSQYIEAMGFVNLQIAEMDIPLDEGGTTSVKYVESMTVNQEALDNYLADHPVTPAPEPEPTAEEDLMAMAVDHEYRLTLLELGLGGDM